jgi:4-oxalocrotonate tautomerase
MPVVRVSFFEGRTDEQKEKLALVITDAIVEIAGSGREGVNIIYDEVARENWYIGGKPTKKRGADS